MKLKLVTGFAELKTGDLVLVECQHAGCMKTHVSILLNPLSADCWGADGVLRYYPKAFQFVTHLDNRRFFVTPRGVELRVVYKVDTGLQLPTQVVQKKATV